VPVKRMSRASQGPGTRGELMIAMTDPECCDGSDEWASGACPNRCFEIGKEYRAQREAELKTRKTVSSCVISTSPSISCAPRALSTGSSESSKANSVFVSKAGVEVVQLTPGTRAQKSAGHTSNGRQASGSVSRMSWRRSAPRCCKGRWRWSGPGVSANGDGNQNARSAFWHSGRGFRAVD
jgi:hypothetical protein